MADAVASSDYSSAAPSPRMGHPPPGRMAGEAQPSQAATSGAAATERCGRNEGSVEAFLQALARAVHQFHTYPASSPLCVEAITACHKVLATGDGPIALRVTPQEVVVGDVGIGAGTIVEYELVRRLYRARVTALHIDCAATPRDLSRFCGDLIVAADRGEAAATLADTLAEHGVATIVPQTACRPEVLELGAPSPALCELAAHERSRKPPGTAQGPSVYLYPRDKGWVRLDPSSSLEAVSLAELAVLADDPSRVAAMLQRLTDGDGKGRQSNQTPLEEKYSEVATLFASLDPQLGRLMYAKLARAVLDLEPARRRDLLRRTVLPGLLDGQVDGAVLQDFPDVELAEALGLLLDLENARPEILRTALDRLELPADRARAVAPLIDAEVRARTGGSSAGTSAVADAGAERYARDLVRVDASAGKMFADFSSFDLAIDGHTRDVIARIPDEIGTTDLVASQLRCLSTLVRHEPNPGMVSGFLARTSVLLAELERQARWRDIASCLAGHGRLADSLREARPDVADAIAAALGGFLTKERAIRIAELYDGDSDLRPTAGAFMEACAAAAVPALVGLLEDPTLQARIRPLVQLMCDHAARVGPRLAEHLGHTNACAARTIVRVLGFAGPGCEAAIARHFGSGDEQAEREALRALARIGSARAAALVAQQIRQGSPRIRVAAEEALWHFPAAQARSQVKELLSQRDFVIRNPHVAARLLDRASVAGTDGFEPALSMLAPFRYRLWNPALSRLGSRAHRLVRP